MPLSTSVQSVLLAVWYILFYLSSLI